MKVLLIALAVLLAACAALFMAWRNAARERKWLRGQCAELEGTLHSVLTRLSQAEQAAKIAAENRKESDEKIDELHNGDACGNALDVLSKHKDDIH